MPGAAKSSPHIHDMAHKLLTRSDAAVNNKWFRLSYKIQSRIEYFNHMAHAARHPDFDRNEVLKACNEQTDHFFTLLSKLHSVGFNYILQRELGDISEEQAEKHREMLEHRKTVYKEVYDEVKTWPPRKEHFEEAVCLVRERNWLNNDLSDTFLKQIAGAQRDACIKRIEDRLWLQIHDYYKKGWYITFSTLTVNSGHYEKMFIQGSDYWRNYIRKIRRRCAARYCGSWRHAEKYKLDYFHFFAVTERGQQGRLHIHMMLFMKEIWFSDPAAGKRGNDCRHIKDRTLFWPYGIEQHIAVRFGSGDAYARKGWLWPTVDGRPLIQSKPIKICQYITKYLQVTEHIKTTGETESWKIRANHLMGKTGIMEKLKTLNQIQLESLVRMKTYPLPIIIHGRLINSKLIRNLAVKELLERRYHKDLQLIISAKNTALKQLLQHMTQPKPDRKYASIGGLTEKLLWGEDHTSDTYRAFYNAKQHLEK